jgi:hypothetical protein
VFFEEPSGTTGINFLHLQVEDLGKLIDVAGGFSTSAVMNKAVNSGFVCQAS